MSTDSHDNGGWGQPYEVGYGKPPKQHQFKKGISGNPRGRKKKDTTKRLIITLPPRSLKSTIASVAFPAYLLGHNPSAKLICLSYASDLSFDFARKCRALMNSKFYRDLFPGTMISSERDSVADFVTTQRGHRISTSVGGTLTGRGGDVVIVDDFHKPDEALSDARRNTALQWFDNTLYSRLDDKNTGAIVIVMQRLKLFQTSRPRKKARARSPQMILQWQRVESRSLASCAFTMRCENSSADAAFEMMSAATRQ